MKETDKDLLEQEYFYLGWKAAVKEFIQELEYAHSFDPKVKKIVEYMKTTAKE